MTYSLHVKYDDSSNPFIMLTAELPDVLSQAKFTAKRYPAAVAYIHTENDTEYNGDITGAVKWLQKQTKKGKKT